MTVKQLKAILDTFSDDTRIFLCEKDNVDNKIIKDLKFIQPHYIQDFKDVKIITFSSFDTFPKE